MRVVYHNVVNTDKARIEGAFLKCHGERFSEGVTATPATCKELLAATR